MGNVFVRIIVCLFLVSYCRAQETKGTDGDDSLVVEAISGEPQIEQDYRAAGTGATGPNGETLRADDPDDPLDPVTDTYFPAQPYDDMKSIMLGKAGADEFLIQTYISGKVDIVAQHVNDDDTINWGMNNVAGENDNAHDHWVEYFGLVQINDYTEDDGDTIRVRGHTVALNSLVVSDGDTYIIVQSQQGDGGGAHDEDILGYIVVRDAELNEDDIEFDRQDDGIVATFTEFLVLVDYYEAIAGTVKNNKTTVKRRP